MRVGAEQDLALGIQVERGGMGMGGEGVNLAFGTTAEGKIKITNRTLRRTQKRNDQRQFVLLGWWGQQLLKIFLPLLLNVHDHQSHVVFIYDSIPY